MEQTNEIASFSKQRIIKNITVLSIGFLLLYTAYNGLTMLQSTMNKMQGIGTAGQAVLYMTYGITSLLISSYAIKKLGIKIAQTLGMVLYLPYIAANFYPAWITIIPSAMLIGLGSTLNWASQCTYFNECSVLYTRIVNKSRVNSINSAGVQTSNTTLNYTSSVQMTEKQVPPNMLQQKWTKVDFNKDNKDINLTTNSLQSNHLSNGAPKIVHESYHQLSEKSKEENNSEKSIGEFYTRINSETKPSEKLKSDLLYKKDYLSCSSAPEVDIQKLKKPKTLSSTNAMFFGFHGLAYCSSQIWSNLICFSVLNYGVTKNLNTTLDYSCGAGFCNDEEYVEESIEEVSNETRYLLTGLCVVCGAIGALVVWLFLDNIDRKEENVTFSFDQFLVTIKYIQKKEQFYVIPMTILGGMIQAFYTADITKSYIACAWTISEVGIVTVFYGITSAFSSILSGVLIKYFGRIPVLLLCQILNVGNLIFLLLWIPDASAPYMFYIEGAAFGFIAGIFLTQTKALYGTYFEGDEETAFSSCNMYSSVGWSVAFLTSDFLCTSVKIYILLAMSCLGIVGYLMSERSFSLHNKSKE